MDSEKIEQYTTDVGIRFLQTCYACDPNVTVDHANVERLRYLRKLLEFQLHGAIIPKAHKRKHPYDIPEAFRAATDAFLVYWRFEGIIEKNICTVSLYLERFFSYFDSTVGNTSRANYRYTYSRLFTIHYGVFQSDQRPYDAHGAEVYGFLLQKRVSS